MAKRWETKEQKLLHLMWRGHHDVEGLSAALGMKLDELAGFVAQPAIRGKLAALRLAADIQAQIALARCREQAVTKLVGLVSVLDEKKDEHAETLRRACADVLRSNLVARPDDRELDAANQAVRLTREQMSRVMRRLAAREQAEAHARREDEVEG